MISVSQSPTKPFQRRHPMTHQVNVLTRRPQDWGTAIAITTEGSSWEHKGDFVGPLHKVSDNPAEVVPGSEVVIVAAPANAHPDLLRKVAPHVDYGARVGALFAQGGFDWAAKQAFGPERCEWLISMSWLKREEGGAG